MDTIKKTFSEFFSDGTQTDDKPLKFYQKKWFKLACGFVILVIIIAIAYCTISGTEISGFLPDRYGERSDLGGDDDDDEDFSMKTVFAKYKRIQDKFLKRKK